MQPLRDVAAIEDFGVAGDVAAQEDFRLAEIGGEDEFADQAARRHAIPAGVVRRLLLRLRRRAGGAVELRLLRLDEDVVARGFAVVDARLLHLEIARAARRDVAEDDVRVAAADHLVRRAGDHAVAVRVDQVAVLPRLRLRRQLRRVQLARREHDLSVLSVHLIAVDVDIAEGVILPDLLQLRVRLEEHIAVPQADVVDRGAIRIQPRARRLPDAGQLLLIDAYRY